MNKKAKTILNVNIKLIITILIIAAFVWFLILSPFITFKSNEKKLEQAARRYYEINTSELPTGDKRMSTVSLKQLYYKKIITSDMYVPYTKEPCSVDDSWVKVRQEDGKYKYYTYLKCGVLSSNIDHNGPEIRLNGKEEITVDRYDKYEDAGIASVVDNTDGKMSISDVTVKNNVNTSKIGKYEVTFTATDSFKNKTTVTRKVTVVERLKNTVKAATNKKGYYTGYNPNNYMTFSGMSYRIVDIDGENVRIVATDDVANVNFDGISDWLRYYYEHINDSSRRYIVANKYCNMNLTDTTLDTTECQQYTNKVRAYIPSISDINKAEASDGNFLRPATMSWTANGKDSKNAYLTRNQFFDEFMNNKYFVVSKTSNYGVRPMLTIKGATQIISGDGTEANPYSIGDVKKAATGDFVNTRVTGEYVKYANTTWQIIEAASDGTTKVISTSSIYNGEDRVLYNYQPSKTIYNPKETDNVGYYINNRISQFIDTSLLVNHNIKVPIYKTNINYGKEESTKTYNVKISAPNMYEMFSAHNHYDVNLNSYWMLNSSKKQNTIAALTDIGVPVNNTITDYERYGVRAVGYLNKSTVIGNGKGTQADPYKISK